MDRRTAYLILNSLPGIGPGRIRLLTNAFGSPEKIFEASNAELARVPTVGAKLAGYLQKWQDFCNPDKEFRLAADSGAMLVTWEDEAYPKQLREIHDPPVCLYVRGSLETLRDSSFSLAIVGSRRTTSYGMRMANVLASDAAREGWTVVSGLAHGIDTCAHQAVVRSSGKTIAVLGSGLYYLYPQENRPLAREICEKGGAVISEFPMLYRPDRHSFPMRNRIISGLSRGTIVVEAGLQSGSLITAAQSLEQGRSVFAVPGLADQPYSQGCHALIRDGARLIEKFQDVTEEFSLLPDARLASRQVQELLEATPEPPLYLKGLEYRIWESLDGGEMTLDELVNILDEPPSTLLPVLLVMELKTAIIQKAGRIITRGPHKNIQKSPE